MLFVFFQSINTQGKTRKKAASHKITHVENAHVIMENKESRARNFTLSMMLPIERNMYRKKQI